MIATVYMIVAEMRFPVIYNYWAIIGLDAYEVVIWLTAMALQASEISNINQLLNYFTQGPLVGSSSSSGTPSTVNPFGDPTTSSPDSSSTSTSSSSSSSSSGSCGSQETLIAGVCIPNNYLGSSKLVRSLPTPGDIFNNFKSVNDGKTFRDICAVNSALAGIALYVYASVTLLFRTRANTTQSPFCHHADLHRPGPPPPSPERRPLHARAERAPQHLSRAQGQIRRRAAVRIRAAVTPAPPAPAIPAGAAVRPGTPAAVHPAATSTVRWGASVRSNAATAAVLDASSRFHCINTSSHSIITRLMPLYERIVPMLRFLEEDAHWRTSIVSCCNCH
jgi:hypothetical protein